MPPTSSRPLTKPSPSHFRILTQVTPFPPTTHPPPSNPQNSVRYTCHTPFPCISYPQPTSPTYIPSVPTPFRFFYLLPILPILPLSPSLTSWINVISSYLAAIGPLQWTFIQL